MFRSEHSRIDVSSTEWTDRVVDFCHHRATAWAILGVSLLLTGIAWAITNRHIERRTQDRFDFRVTEVQEKIQKRMNQYQHLLRDALAFYSASEHVSREEWRDFVNYCRVSEYFPGTQALGVAHVVEPELKSSHEEQIRGEGFPDYRIYPEGPRDPYTAIVYIEPFDWRNQRAFGYDMYSESVRREAMDRAARSGLPALSGKVTLVQETQDDVQNGVLFYLPAFGKADEEHGSKPLIGWVYAAFRMSDLMHGVVDGDWSDIAFRIYDTEDATHATELFSSHDEKIKVRHATYQASRIVPVAGRNWTIQFSSRPEFFDHTDRSVSPTVAILGLMIDGLLFLVIASIGRQRTKAIELAVKMTEDLKHTESRNRSILKNASDAILHVRPDGKIMSSNDAARKMYSTDGEVEVLELDDLLFDELLDNATFRDLVRQSVAAATKRSSEPSRISVQCRRTDGAVFPCQISIACLDREEGFVIIARDQTARMKFDKQLEETNRQLINASRKAGMAEVATGVLHNVGNSLNCVGTSSAQMDSVLRSSAVSNLVKAAALIDEHSTDLADFLTQDVRGKHFVEFLKQVTLALQSEQAKLLEENQNLLKHVQDIKQTIRTQQSDACATSAASEESAAALFEQAASVNSNRHAEYDISIEKELEPDVAITTDRNRVLQILVNLIANAQDALRETEQVPRIVRLQLKHDQQYVWFVVEDNGPGISEEVLPMLRQFGFTTKEDGHGFGLHSCDNAAQALGGSLIIENNQSQPGATFTLQLPLESNLQKPSSTDSSASSSIAPQVLTQGDHLTLGGPGHEVL